MKKTLAEIAELTCGRLAGDGDICVTGVSSLDDASSSEITFADEKHLDEARSTHAAAYILPEGAGDFPAPAVYVEDVRAAFARLLEAFTPKLVLPEGVSPEAHVGKDVKLGHGVRILPFAVVDDHAQIGDHTIIYPHVYSGQYASGGADTLIYSHVTIREHCVVGDRCIIQPSAVIGSDGFGFTTKDGVHTKVPQVGNAVIEDDCEIGANDCIDRATTGSTVIGHGTKIDNLVHIVHNCKIGEGCLIVAQTGISGSTQVGHHVTFGGQTGTVGHIKIGANSLYAARTGIIGNMPEGVFCAGFPAQPHKEWLKMQAMMKRLPELRKEIKELRKQLADKQK